MLHLQCRVLFLAANLLDFLSKEKALCSTEKYRDGHRMVISKNIERVGNKIREKNEKMKEYV